ncbi:hypothetical protein P7F88_14945 [Vibrio hannami]|uniref:type IV pilus modification PilV family protein n=1 Tax=Vibrio hannami TaxID=2717094 RepID=UPI0024103317|nr:hypothetical protein [Vibrio hannami]MDG3087304.1 hypothetical protein [Vibrio hannami]
MISKQRGATLLEVLIASSLIVFGVMGNIRLQVYMEQKTDYAHRSTEALRIAESRMERLSIEFSEHSDAVETLNEEVQLDNEYELIVSISKLPTATSGDVYHVSVEVIWQNNQSEVNSVSLSTVMTIYS